MKKTNKTFKRFAAITSASLLAACAVAPVAFNAFAESTIKIDGFSTSNPNDATTHEFEAYQIFAGKISGDDKVLTQIKWGTGIKAGEHQNLLNALATKNVAFAESVTYAIPNTETELTSDYNEWVAAQEESADKSVNAFYKTIADDETKAKFDDSNRTPYTYSATDDKSAEAIADVLATNTDFDNDLAKDFAEVVGKYLSTTSKDSEVVTKADDEADTYGENYIEGDVIIPGLDDGYYLIQDKDRSSIEVNGENNGAKTRFILQVTDNATVEVNVKASAPTVMKKVQEDSLATTAQKTSFAGKSDYSLGNGYNDVADYAIGDDVPFKLYGTMPSTLDDYDHYYYKFTDTLGDEFGDPQNVKVYVVNGTSKVEIKNAVEGYIPNYEYEKATTGNDFTIEFKDVKNIVDNSGNKVTIDKNTIIEVEYTAKLLANAKIGYEGQLNKVDLTYSNNPNEEYIPWDEDGNKVDDKPDGTGETKEDGVIVFTYGFDINKFTGVETNKLAGAKFAVYYLDENNNEVYIATDNNNCYAGDLAAEPTAETAVKNENGVWESVATAGTNIVIKGLDVGEYYIKEITPPEGYNPLTEDVKVTVSSTIEKTVDGEAVDSPIYTQDWTYSENANFVYAEGELTGYSAMDLITINYAGKTVNVADDTDDLGTVDIENKKGTALPGTGGIGTTIFYLGGGAMAAIGGIYLISKRRMRKSEE